MRDEAQKFEPATARGAPNKITKGMLRALLQGGTRGQQQTYRNRLNAVPIAALAIVRLAGWLDTFHIAGA